MSNINTNKLTDSSVAVYQSLKLLQAALQNLDQLNDIVSKYDSNRTDANFSLMAIEADNSLQPSFEVLHVVEQKLEYVDAELDQFLDVPNGGEGDD